jgi:hypothetical protein
MNNDFSIKFAGLVLIAASFAFAAPAVAFTLQDDPSSLWDDDASTTEITNGNVRTAAAIASMPACMASFTPVEP